MAKAIHPDLAVNEAERAFRTALMVRANTAYRNGDQQALEQILSEWEHRDETSFLEEAAKESNQLGQKIAQVAARLKEIETRITALKESDLYQLMKRVERAEGQGRDLLGAMASDLQARILNARKNLDSLIQQERS